MHPAQVFRKFGELSPKEQMLLPEAYFLHLTTGLLLKVIPFRWIPKVFSARRFETPAKAKSRKRTGPDAFGSAGKEDQSRTRTSPEEAGSAVTEVASRQSEVVRLIKMAVARAGRVSPWRNRCLVSSLVARRMLNRRKIPSKLSLGVAKDTEGRTVAHAWIISGDIEVTGKHGDYRELFVF